MIDNREVGRRIAALRQGGGLTQMQLAAMMNVSHQAVSKWESGQAMPDIQTLLALTQFFGLTVEQLIGAEQAEDARADETQRDAGAQARESEKVEANQMNIQQLLQMAPYMTKEAVAEIAMGIDEKLSAGQIARLAPYLAPECVEALVEKHHPEFTWESLRRLAPHMRRETVDELARAIASGRETVKSGEDSFNKAMNDIGRAFDDFGRGMDKAVRKAIRFGGSVLNEVSSAISELANDAPAADARVRSERALALRRMAFERALADGKWDWLGEHVAELAEGDELRKRIAARARELGMGDWVREHLGGDCDAEAIEAAIREGCWDWLGEHVDAFEPEAQRATARAAAEAGNWAWLDAHAALALGEDAPGVVRMIWRGGERALAARIAQQNFTAEQFDKFSAEALSQGDAEMADLLWGHTSPACADARLLALAEATAWEKVKEFIAFASDDALERLMERAVEQGNFDAVDFLDQYL